MKLRKYKKKKLSSYISFGLIIIVLSLILSLGFLFYKHSCHGINFENREKKNVLLYSPGLFEEMAG